MGVLESKLAGVTLSGETVTWLSSSTTLEEERENSKSL